MPVNVELWQPVIIEELFDTNEFLNFAYNADDYVVGGRIVHIPQSGGPSGAQKNRAVLPAPVVQRGDTDIAYVLDTYTTDPKLIDNGEKVELSYDKRASIIREDTEEMMQMVGDNVLYDWAVDLPLGNIVDASGDAAPSTLEGTTGNRKIITEKDFFTMKERMDKQKVSRKNRYAVLDSSHVGQMFQDSQSKQYTQMIMDLKEGKIGKLAGFNILDRSVVIRLAADGSAKLPESATAIDDEAAAIFFHKSCVERAIGDMNMFDENGKPQYYGDIFSFLIRAKGRRRRADNKGVFLLRNKAA